MPFVEIKLRKGVTTEQKEKLIKGVTDLLVSELGKDPNMTHVVIQEYEVEDWGIAGESVANRIKTAKSK